MDSAENFQPGGVREVDVQDDHVGAVADDRLDPFRGRGGGEQGHLRLTESLAEEVQDRRLVIDHQQGRHGPSSKLHQTRLGRGTFPYHCDAGAGRRSKKQAPPPGKLYAERLPPCSSAMRLDTGSPSPTPVSLLLTKVSNTLGRMCGAMPGPVSRT